MVKLVFVNGTFDILHTGHLALLDYAKSLGDRLFVGIDSDRRVSELKGITRPINKVDERKTMLEHLKPVDEVMVFDSDEELTMLVKQIRPHFMVVGSDYKNKTVIGSEWARQLIFFDKIDGKSTTQKIQNIINR